MQQKIESVIIDTLQNLADEFECEELAHPNATTIIYGNNGVPDSLALVSFITDLEQQLTTKLGITVTLADEKAMSVRNSPFKDVATLTQYILTQTSQKGEQ